jgi:hypothetical protein
MILLILREFNNYQHPNFFRLIPVQGLFRCLEDLKFLSCSQLSIMKININYQNKAIFEYFCYAYIIYRPNQYNVKIIYVYLNKNILSTHKVISNIIAI